MYIILHHGVKCLALQREVKIFDAQRSQDFGQECSVGLKRCPQKFLRFNVEAVCILAVCVVS